MPRVDIWDVEASSKKLQDIDCGFPRDLQDHYQFDRVLGKGGFGLVRVVIEKSTGIEFACKSIRKRLDIPNLSVVKQAAHLDNVKREIHILKKLRGTLSVVHFKGAWEDDENLHLVMEFCRGGELIHQVGRRAYSEETAATYLRSVLHTLAQCHSHRILHRDIKPGNFMLLTEEEDSPLKAIDFGLAVFFDPDKLPRTDLGLEGTAWFMAPEALSSETYPASDIWAAGVMAYQLLSGYLPFDDARNPEAPALSVIWRGILTEEPSFRRSAWKDISEEAKDFVKALLNKDHTKRPTAKDALKHPWLQAGFHAERKRPISHTVVQRIQRYAQTNVLQRTILELIAQELVEMMPPALSMHGSQSYQQAQQAQQAQPIDSSGHNNGHEGVDEALLRLDSTTQFPMSPEMPSYFTEGGSPPASQQDFTAAEGGGGQLERRSTGDLSAHGGGEYYKSLLGRSVPRVGGSLHGGRTFARSPSSRQLATLAGAAGRKGASVHGGDYWRIMRAASELAAMETGHGKMSYLRTVSRSEDDREEQRKAARLSLDTSAHGGTEYGELLRKLEAAKAEEHLRHKKSLRTSSSVGSLNLDGVASPPQKEGTGRPPRHPPSWLEAPKEAPSVGYRGFPPPDAAAAATAPPLAETEGGQRGRGGSAVKALLEASGEGGTSPPLGVLATVVEAPAEQQQAPQVPTEYHRGSKRVSFLGEGSGASSAVSCPERMMVDGGSGAPASEPPSAAAEPRKGPITTPNQLEELMRQMQFKKDQGLSAEALASGLQGLGYDLEPSEVAILMSELDINDDGRVQPHEFVASQLDWASLQQSNRELWLECARRAFASLDSDSDGRLKLGCILKALRSKLPADEVDYAVEDALVEAGYADADEMDFEGFLRMVQVGSLDSLDSLDQYDPRMRQMSHPDDLRRLASVPEDAAGGSPRVRK